MTHARPFTRSSVLRALPSLLLALVLAALIAPRASAAQAPYGGLGRVGASTIKAGNENKEGQVSPGAAHSFAVDTKTGQFFIAEEGAEGNKTIDRIQEFGAKGEFLAENRFSTKVGNAVGGLAVDAAKGRVYLLLSEFRPEENVAKVEQIEAKEKQIEAAEHKKESTTALEAELTQLEKELEEEPVFDPGDNAAAEIWQFSTEQTAGKLKEQKLLASAETLKWGSEEPRAAIVVPSGIAVDEKNHDIVVLGQQNQSSDKEEEELTTVVQRVHEEGGTLGPRYVDTANCLDEGFTVASEPACAAKPHVEFARSPIVTPQGTVYVELFQSAGEIWEMPATQEPAEGFKEITVQPKRVFTLSNEAEQQKLVTFAGSEEGVDTMSYTPVSPTEGRIFVAGDLEGNLSGIVVLNYVENEGKATVTERGWTGGQSQVSKEEKCAIPAANRTILLGGGTDESVLVLDARRALEEQPALVAVMEFGTGGEHCGHVKASPPVVRYQEQNNAEEVPAGAPTTISSVIAGANAVSATWTFKYKLKGGGEGTEGPFETGYQFEGTSLPHEFQHAGEYEIVENVRTDNLGEPEVAADKRTSKLIVSQGPPTVKVAAPSGVREGEGATFEANIVDHNEEKPHLTITWNFGDGTPPVVEEETASSSTVVRKLAHTFAAPCPLSCLVTVKVKDGAGSEGSGRVEVPVLESVQHEEERHKREQEENQPPPTTNTTTTTTTTTTGGGGVLNEKQLHNPEAKIAGTSLRVSKNGSFTVKLTCPAGQSQCAGTVTVKTLGAVSAKKKKKKSVLTLATGSFTLSGGQVKSITLHLSAKGKTLLAHSHTLRALATVVAHDASGATRTTTATLTLKPVKASHKH